MRNLLWITVGVLAGLAAFGLIQAAMTLPSSQFDIILGSALVAVVAVIVAIVVVVAVREALEDRRHKAAMDAAEADLDEAEAHLAPLLTGSAGAEKRMRRYFHDHGQILVNRASKQTRRVAAALDAYRRPGWMLRHRPRMRRAVWDNPAPVMEAPPLAPLPEPPATDLPDMHAAPVVDTADEDLKAIEAELSEDSEDGSLWAPDNTMWRVMKADLFAMLEPASADQGDEVTS